MGPNVARDNSVEPKSEPALVVNQLTKRFGDRTAFDDVSFEVDQGDPKVRIVRAGAHSYQTLQKISRSKQPQVLVKMTQRLPQLIRRSVNSCQLTRSYDIMEGLAGLAG